MEKDRIAVVLGTAHEEFTPGKGSPDGCLREPRYSREILLEVDAILKSYGIRSFIDYLPMEPRKEWRSTDWHKEQERELAWRVNFVNNLCRRYGAKNVIYVSLHNDAAGADGKWHTAGGFSVWTTKGTTRSDQLAECIYDAAERNLAGYKATFAELKRKGLYGEKQQPIRMDLSDGDRDWEAGYFVLRKTACPAVLIEAMFQDNKNDVAFLLSDEGRQSITRTIVEGVIKYIESL